ncbi:Zinc finger RING-type [Trinorchestia longiramus]|nr:Zinc finger RING-type [Trinorchestia longiramus]
MTPVCGIKATYRANDTSVWNQSAPPEGDRDADFVQTRASFGDACSGAHTHNTRSELSKKCARAAPRRYSAVCLEQQERPARECHSYLKSPSTRISPRFPAGFGRTRVAQRYSSREVPNHFLDFARLIATGGYWEQVGLQYSDLYGEKPPPPTSKEVIANLKTIIIDEKKVGQQCPVCLKLYELAEKCHQLPCDHLFHATCVLPWLNKTNSCPMCRHELKTDDEVYEEYRLRKKNESERKAQIEALHDSMFS